MKRFKGIGASQGIAIGRLAFFENARGFTLPGAQTRSNDMQTQRLRLDRALQIARETLDHLRERVEEEVGREGAMIIEVQRMLLDDEEMYREAVGLIEFGRCTADYAVQMVGKHAIQQIASLEDSYLRERTADIKDLTQRVCGILQGKELKTTDQLGGQFVVASTDLLPSTMVQIDPSKVLAVICRDGSEISHAAIIARSMGLPSVLRIGAEQFALLGQYDTVVVDGFRGELVLDPDERTLAYYRQVREQYQDHRMLLKRLRGLPSRTVDGVEVVISADISRMADMFTSAENDTLEIGLFRCQVFSFGQPQEKENHLYEIYREMLSGIGRSHRMTVRMVPFCEECIHWVTVSRKGETEKTYQFEREPCRISDFAVQMRALLRAAVFGKLAMVIPGVSNPEQMNLVHAMLQSCLQELKEKKMPCSVPEIGILVEDAEGAAASEKLVWMGDFFLVDMDLLTRHTVMEDHMGNLVRPYDARHPAVTHALQKVTDAASRRNIRCGVCGQAASDSERVETFLAMGINEFVVPPPQVLEVREKVREIDLGRRKWTKAKEENR